MMQLSPNLPSQAGPKLPLSQNRAQCVTHNTSPTFSDRDVHGEVVRALDSQQEPKMVCICGGGGYLDPSHK